MMADSKNTKTVSAPKGGPVSQTCVPNNTKVSSNGSVPRVTNTPSKGGGMKGKSGY